MKSTSKKLVVLVLLCSVTFIAVCYRKRISSRAEQQKPHNSDTNSTVTGDRHDEPRVPPLAVRVPEPISLLELDKLPSSIETNESVLKEVLAKDLSALKSIFFYQGIKYNDNKIIQLWSRCNIRQCVGTISMLAMQGDHLSILNQADLPVPEGFSPWRLDGIGILHANILSINDHKTLFLHYRAMGPPGREVGSASYDYLVIFGLPNLSQELWQEITHQTGQEIDPKACIWSVKRGPVKGNEFEDLQVTGCNGSAPITRSYHWKSTLSRYIESN